MKAVQFTQYGGPEVLQVVEVDEPHAGPGEVRIAVRAAGVNAIDWKTRAGYMKEHMPLSLPAGSGLDAAGVIDEVGDGVVGVSVGDSVFGSGSATMAEYAVLTSWAEKPAELTFAEAAGYPLPVETAIRILSQVRVQPGETLLVSGAAGGVGSAVVQIARHRGITVIATAGEQNQGYLRSLGAIPTTYGEGLSARVRALTKKIDAAFDLAGSGVVPELVRLTGEPAKVVSIADFTAPQFGAQVSAAQADMAAALAEAARLASEGVLRMRVEKAFSLATVRDAHVASAAGHVAGRFVVAVTENAWEK